MSSRTDVYAKLRTVDRKLKSLEADEAAAYEKHLGRFSAKRMMLHAEKSVLLAAIDGEDGKIVDEVGPDSE